MSISSRTHLLSRLAAVVALLAFLAATPIASAGPAPARERASRRASYRPVVVIAMENHGYSTIMSSRSAVYFRRFARSGRLFTNYDALHQHSLPNYLEMTSGTAGGCRNDHCPTGTYRRNNVFHQLSRKGISWRTWAESMKTNCRTWSAGTYAHKHNPALYYRNLFPRTCRTHDVPLPHRLPRKLPRFVFLTPNLCHDMHDCSIETGNRWLHRMVPRLRRRGAIVVIVFDEGTDGKQAGGHVYAAVAGHGIRRGGRDGHSYTHRSLLAGIERHFGLRRLHGARRARPLPL